MNFLPRTTKLAIAVLVGAVAVPAAAVAIIFGAFMLLLGGLAFVMSAAGQSFFRNGAEKLVIPELIVVFAGAVVLVLTIEFTGLLIRGVQRRRLYTRAISVGMIASICVLPVVGLMSYATLHGRTEPGLPLPLILVAVISHVVIGSIVWPVWVVRPLLKPSRPTAVQP